MEPEPPLLIAGGTVWGEEGSRRADVRVAGGRITAIGTLEPSPGERVIDATGLHVLPGMIDVHVHAGDRIGRCELADTWETASRVALATGITTMAGFVTQQAGETLTAAVERCRTRTTGTSCGIRFHLTPTTWPWGWPEVESLVAQGFTTFKLYTTYRHTGLFTSYDRLVGVMPRLAELGATLLVHCEDDALLDAVDTTAADPAAPITHALRRPAEAEIAAVGRVIELAARTGCPTHVVHVSTAEAAELVAAARYRAPVTCETAPHYLLLNDDTLRGPAGHRWLCTPPLRNEDNRCRMETLAAAGAFDLLATDHCAFRKTDKDGWDGRDVAAVPCGIAGLGALVPLTFELLVQRHRRPLTELVRLLAANPARLLGLHPRKGALLVGSDADITILDPNRAAQPIRSTFARAWETYPDRTTTLDVRHVIRAGRIVPHPPVTGTGDCGPGTGPTSPDPERNA